MINIIMVINAGSSSIKVALLNQNDLSVEYHSTITGIHEEPEFTVTDKQKNILVKKKIEQGYEAAFDNFFAWYKNSSSTFTIVAVGHRIVHGGKFYDVPTKITPKVLENLATLIPMAPLHQPQSLDAIAMISKFYPQMLQVACFDTSFHTTQLKLASRFAIPRELTASGVMRYGFHGISYEYIASVLPDYIGPKANAKVIVAHLGNGSSMCAMHERKSVATSMGFTALDGLMMGTRCGNIDPGVLLYMMQEKKYTVPQLEKLLYKQSGLLGVSGISADVLDLTQSKAPEAAEAIDLYCLTAACKLGSLATVIRGCDAIIFTAGIGENSNVVRTGICKWLDWLGVKLNEQANNENKAIISDATSKVLVAVIPTNEQCMIAKHTKTFL